MCSVSEHPLPSSTQAINQHNITMASQGACTCCPLKGQHLTAIQDHNTSVRKLPQGLQHKLLILPCTCTWQLHRAETAELATVHIHDVVTLAS